ncbi:MAG: preprotein translocase subunit YajC [Clostridia bacterium]|nr:preprotein translocase subunit YajC [Clostridia bacterium]
MDYILLSATTGTGTEAAPQGSMWGSLIMIIGFVALMYFMLIRPQKKQQKKEKQMRENLQIGDEIITIGGIYGRVVSLKEDSLVIESSGDRSKIQVQRSAVGQNLTIHE